MFDQSLHRILFAAMYFNASGEALLYGARYFKRCTKNVNQAKFFSVGLFEASAEDAQTLVKVKLNIVA
jgi:hypothetical protein